MDTTFPLQGIISSPSFPSPYEDGLNCHWKIIAPHGSQLRIELLDLDIEKGNNCKYDYLQIIDDVLKYNITALTKINQRYMKYVTHF